jgi:capsular polysaccharide transport system ATP-binding protein
MIELSNVVKRYRTRAGYRTVLDGIDLTIRPGEKVGILGMNGAGKSTLIRMISGVEYPSSGTVRRTMSVSWPLAFSGGFQGSLTGLDNLKFVCRVYGRDYREAEPFVREFAELGSYFTEPVKNYSSGMRARLAFALSMAIEFDCFLIDEVVTVGDSRFHEKCERELFERRRDRALIFVSHDRNTIAKHCQRANVLRDGKLHEFQNIDDAYAFHDGHSFG